jgi:maleylpyruvate isomerase
MEAVTAGPKTICRLSTACLTSLGDTASRPVSGDQAGATVYLLERGGISTGALPVPDRRHSMPPPKRTSANLSDANGKGRRPVVSPDTEIADPDAVAAELRARVDDATARVQRAADAITDQQAGDPSLLPGWSRGHLLTHLARNADGLRNLLVSARTGVQTPQYPSVQARNDGIEAGAGRPAAELAADIAGSAARFAAEAGLLAGADWLVEVHGVRGRGHPAWFTLFRRLSELEIHHVDLGLGYRVADWPAQFASQSLPRVAGDFSGPDSPAAVLRSADDGTEHHIGPAGEPATIAITGPTRELLAWLIGRDAGGRLVTEPAGPLPVVPSWG